MKSKASHLRDLVEAEDILVWPGVYDGLSARLVEQMGFASATITGAGISETRLGWEDVGLMGLETNSQACRQIAAACSIPLFADGDTGYGNAINAYFTVQAFENAGVAGLMIEDQQWPKRCGHLKGKSVISAEEMVTKVQACCDARKSMDFMIKARTDSYATDGLKEVIRRLNLYAEAGADLLFADALMTEDDIATVARNVSKPLQVNMGFGIRERGTTPLIPAARLQELGVAVVSYPRLLTASAVEGMRKGLSALQEQLKTGQVVHRPELLVSMEDLCSLMGLDVINEMERKYAINQ